MDCHYACDKQSYVVTDKICEDRSTHKSGGSQILERASSSSFHQKIRHYLKEIVTGVEPRPPPARRSFIYGVACMRPAAFASGGRSHCVQYLSGSFDILI